MSKRLTVAVLFACLAGCDDPPTSPSPTPTPTTMTPTTTPREVRPVDPRFDDQFWRDFVYVQYDRERNGYSGPYPGGSWVLDHVRDFYIDTTDMPSGLPQFIEAGIPRLWRDLTGSAFTGRVESGRGARPHPGWTSVQVAPRDYSYCGSFADLLERGRNDHNAINLRPDCNMRRTFVHEFGHALGFGHVREPWSVMARSAGGDSFTAREMYHAQLAYEVGHGATYCGWPYSEECQ